MKNYTVIPIEAAEKLSLNDLYVFTVLSLTAHDDNATDVTYEQLAEFTGKSLGYIKDHFAKRLKNSGLCSIEEFSWAGKRRKKYTLPIVRDQFRIILREVIEDRRLTSEEKGFLIALYCIGFNNSFNMDISTKCGVLFICTWAYQSLLPDKLTTPHFLFYNPPRFGVG